MTPEELLRFSRSQAGIRGAREFLCAYGRLDAEIAVKLSRLDRTRERADRLKSLPRSQEALQAAEELTALEASLLRDYGTLTLRQRQIGDVIRRVPDERQRTVLEMRYLDQQPFFRIAMRMHYDERQIYRYHRQGLQYVALLAASGQAGRQIRDRITAQPDP